mgnify:CR=1 FL=1|jgi:hypothetical protein
MRVYIVTVNGKVSQEAYKTLEDAQRFIIGRTGIANIISENYLIAEDTDDNRYEIHDVVVR